MRAGFKPARFSSWHESTPRTAPGGNDKTNLCDSQTHLTTRWKNWYSALDVGYRAANNRHPTLAEKEDRKVTVELNHTIVWCRDKQKSANLFTELFGLPSAKPFGPMLVVPLNNNVSIDFYDNDGEISSQHYAFLIGEDDFDQIFGRIRDRGLKYWADPYRKRPGEISRNDGGRGVYFEDPDGHFLEILTRPYGSGE